MAKTPPAAAPEPGSAERERVGLHARREAELERRVFCLKRAVKCVQAVAVDVHGLGRRPVHEDADPAATAEDEVDVLGDEMESKPRVGARDDALSLDAPAARVGEA